MMWTVIGFVGLAMLIIAGAAVMGAAEEDELMRYRRDDDQGVRVREDGDDDGDCQR